VNIKKEESTSFCEQKEAKKLYPGAWGLSNTARSGAKKFFGSFFQKRTSCFYSLFAL